LCRSRPFQGSSGHGAESHRNSVSSRRFSFCRGESPTAELLPRRQGVETDEVKAPNTTLQTPVKLQAPNPKSQENPKPQAPNLEPVGRALFGGRVLPAPPTRPERFCSLSPSDSPRCRAVAAGGQKPGRGDRFV